MWHTSTCRHWQSAIIASAAPRQMPCTCWTTAAVLKHCNHSLRMSSLSAVAIEYLQSDRPSASDNMKGKFAGTFAGCADEEIWVSQEMSAHHHVRTKPTIQHTKLQKLEIFGHDLFLTFLFVHQEGVLLKQTVRGWGLYGFAVLLVRAAKPRACSALAAGLQVACVFALTLASSSSCSRSSWGACTRAETLCRLR